MRRGARRSDRRARSATPFFVLVLVLAWTLSAACQSEYGALNLRIATGSTDGVYYQLGSQLADYWSTQLAMPRPNVLVTAGSPDNFQRLESGTADIGFGAADAVGNTSSGPHQLRALARIYDDYIQVVVRADLRITNLAGLSGHTVSVGPLASQVNLVAGRLLAVAGVQGEQREYLSLNDSINALRTGQIDAFFWSGGLPTPSIAELGHAVPVRLLDLSTGENNVLQAMLAKYPVYGAAVVPANTYPGQQGAVNTLVVPNFLLVTDAMPDDQAQALVQGLFQDAPELVKMNPAALGIDVHNAIYTDPVVLHPGALAYYRATKI